MLRPGVAALACALLLAARPAPPDSGAERLGVRAPLRRYAAGDYTVIQRTLRHARRLQRNPADLFSAVGRWKDSWQRRTCVFLLDFCDPGPQPRLADADGSAAGGRDLVRSVPTAPGENAEDDRFEARFTRRRWPCCWPDRLPDAADAYLDTLRDRVIPERLPTSPKARLVEPRMTAAARDRAGDPYAARSW
jgi:hypothetical protein